MNNLQHLELETKGIILEQDELTIYSQENDLQPFTEYNPQWAMVSCLDKKKLIEEQQNEINKLKVEKADAKGENVVSAHKDAWKWSKEQGLFEGVFQQAYLHVNKQLRYSDDFFFFFFFFFRSLTSSTKKQLTIISGCFII